MIRVSKITGAVQFDTALFGLHHQQQLIAEAVAGPENGDLVNECHPLVRVAGECGQPLIEVGFDGGKKRLTFLPALCGPGVALLSPADVAAGGAGACGPSPARRRAVGTAESTAVGVCCGWCGWCQCPTVVARRPSASGVSGRVGPAVGRSRRRRVSGWPSRAHPCSTSRVPESVGGRGSR
jgi:hypothetical protein